MERISRRQRKEEEKGNTDNKKRDENQKESIMFGQCRNKSENGDRSCVAQPLYIY